MRDPNDFENVQRSVLGVHAADATAALDRIQDAHAALTAENERLNGVIDRVLPERTRYRKALERIRACRPEWDQAAQVVVSLQRIARTALSGDTNPATSPKEAG